MHFLCTQIITLLLKGKCNNHFSLPWISHGINFKLMQSYNLKWLLFCSPDLDTPVHHLWQAANTEVKSNCLNWISSLEATIYKHWLIKNDVVYLGQLRSVSASDWIPCETDKDFCTLFHAFPHGTLSMLFNRYRAKAFVRVRQVQKDRHSTEAEDTVNSK